MRRFIVLAGTVATFFSATPVLAQVTNEGLLGQEPLPASTETTASTLLDRMENQHDWSSDDKSKAMDLSKISNAVWFACLGKQELRLRSSKEEIATIATAVFGSCGPQELLFIRSLRQVFRGTGPVTTDEYVTKLDRETREMARETILTYLVNYRLSASKRSK